MKVLQSFPPKMTRVRAEYSGGKSRDVELILSEVLDTIEEDRQSLSSIARIEAKERLKSRYKAANAA
jgi:hypothetical protein